MRSLKKILVVNKYHFISGGAERYFLSIMESLRSRGIEAIPLSVNYRKTIPTPYQKYFIPPVAADGEAKIQNQKPGLKEKWDLALQAVYNRRAVRAVQAVCRDHAIDAAYFLNFNNHISPSAISACCDLGIPVVMRMSDFNLVCAANMYYRDGRPCMDCKKGLYHAVLHRCVHGSFAKSMTAFAAMSLHRAMGIYQKVSAFVAPTEFMRRELLELGYPSGKIHQINTFAAPYGQGRPNLRSPYILFTGRFAPYKGADIAVRAFAAARDKRGVRLLLVGDEGDADAKRVRALVHSTGANDISLMPFERSKEKLLALISGALFTLVPSENYENLPNTILESFACGRPVISTHLGSIPEIIKDGQYGLLYQFGNVRDFSEKIQWLIHHHEVRETMGYLALEALKREYSEEHHIRRLLEVFETASGKGAEKHAVCAV